MLQDLVRTVKSKRKEKQHYGNCKEGRRQEGCKEGRRQEERRKEEIVSLTLRKTGVLCVRTRGWATIPFFFLTIPLPLRVAREHSASTDDQFIDVGVDWY
jgi:hypothetical protein